MRILFPIVMAAGGAVVVTTASSDRHHHHHHQPLSFIAKAGEAWKCGDKFEPIKVESGQNLPNQRPEETVRCFNSKAVENVIDTTNLIGKDLPIIFKNCLPSTLDTTVLWNNETESFIITGDIHAMWLRDSTYQVNPYLTLIENDNDMASLIRGLLFMQAGLIKQYPYANAFMNPKDDNSAHTTDDVVFPKYDTNVVWEAKYELDSLASFLYLSTQYATHKGNDLQKVIDNKTWMDAVELTVKTMIGMQVGTVESIRHPMFTFKRETVTQSETTNLYGLGNPAKTCGLIRSFFRPSDDSTIFQYLIPSNAMAVVALRGVATMLKDKTSAADLVKTMTALADEVQTAITKHAIVMHPVLKKKVYAFEVDCYGSRALMDDANFPSLLSLPRFGYVDVKDPVYQATRQYILDEQFNPYYFKGSKLEGIGSPHTKVGYAWPMALAMRAMTSTNKDEVKQQLDWLVSSTAGTGLMHESVDVNNPENYSRDWFAWSNTVFGDLILYLYDHPEFKDLVREK